MSGEFAPSRVMPLVKAMGAPDAGNPHVRCDEGGGGAFTPPPYSTLVESNHPFFDAVEFVGFDVRSLFLALFPQELLPRLLGEGRQRYR